MNTPAADPLQRLAALLSRLPGIGEKSAMRLALALVRADPEYIRTLAEAVGSVHETLKLCRSCCDLTSTEICVRCSDARRDHTTLCVVAQPQDRMALERAGFYRGLYHVLHGVLDPLGGVGPAEFPLEALLERVEREGVREVILATPPTVEGEATALYLARLLKPLGIRVSRIAMGVPVGSDIEYADEVTMTRAMEGRRDI